MDNGKLKESVERCRANCAEIASALNTAARLYVAILDVLNHEGEQYDVTFGQGQSNIIRVSKAHILEFLWAEVDRVRDQTHRLNREGITASKGAKSMKGDGQ